MLTVFSHPRSGSTYFMSRVRRFLAFRVYMEIFHFNDDTVIQALSPDANEVLGCAGASSISAGGREVRSHILANVDRYLSCLEAVDATTEPVFKVFPFHLPPQGMETLVKRSHAVLLLTRNPLHAYVSWEVARSLNRYGGVDTSEQRVAFSEASLRSFVGDCMRHIVLARQLADRHRKNVAWVRYEDLTAAQSKDDFVAKVLGDFYPERPLTLRSELVEPRRQDSRSDVLDKVNNPDELLDFVSRHDLSRQLVATSAMDWDRWAAIVGVAA